MSTSMDASQWESSTSDTNPLYYSLSAGVRQRVDTLLLAESSRRTSSVSQPQQRGGGGLNELVPPPPLNNASTPTPSPEPWPPSCLPEVSPNPNQGGVSPNGLSPSSDRRRRHATFVDVPNEDGSRGGSEMSRRRHHHHHHPHTIPGVFHRVGWGGIPVGLLAGSGVSSGAGGGVNQIQRRVSRDGTELENLGGGETQPRLLSTTTTPSAQRHHQSQNSSTTSTEELKLQIHQLEYKIRLGLEREQHWMSENHILRDELNNRLDGTNNTGGYAGGDNDDEEIRSNDSQSTIAATTTVRRPPPRENAEDNDDAHADDRAAASSAPPVNPKLLLLHIQADEAAYRSRIEVESMSRLWGEGGSGGGGGGTSSSSSSPSSIWTTFLVESHRASLHTHRSAALQLESVSAQLRIATESNILKTKENCILLDQLKQMQQYHERERKAFRDKLLDVVQSIAGSTVISAASSPPSSE